MRSSSTLVVVKSDIVLAKKLIVTVGLPMCGLHYAVVRTVKGHRWYR